MASFAKAKIRPTPNPKTFEDWVVNQFGRRLFSIFFKTYTEKVWGMSCSEISADWAAQRIKGLSLWSAARNALLPKRKPKDRSQVIKTLIDTFRYPRQGPGMMWERCASRRTKHGRRSAARPQSRTACHFDDSTQRWTITTRNCRRRGRAVRRRARHLVDADPRTGRTDSATASRRRALRRRNGLRYRDFLTIGLILRDKDRFSDNWIYIHDPVVQVGRVQNYKSWSPEMVPDPNFCCYGLEYFCFDGDQLWSSADADLIAHGEERDSADWSRRQRRMSWMDA